MTVLGILIPTRGFAYRLRKHVVGHIVGIGMSWIEKLTNLFFLWPTAAIAHFSTRRDEWERREKAQVAVSSGEGMSCSNSEM